MADRFTLPETLKGTLKLEKECLCNVPLMLKCGLRNS